VISRRWRGTVCSDDGFSVRIASRDTIICREKNRRMAVGGEAQIDGFAICEAAIGWWDGNRSDRIDQVARERIAMNIKHAPESQEMRVYIS